MVFLNFFLLDLYYFSSQSYQENNCYYLYYFSSTKTLVCYLYAQ
jgi:hypothetical protein